MSIQQFVGGSERFIRRYECENSWVTAADVGLSEDEVDVDTVGSTTIVVADTGDRMAEIKFKPPADGDADVAVRSDASTITLTK